MMRSHRQLLLASTLVLAPAVALANPQGAQVVGGQATVQGQGTSTVTVTQGSDHAIINWNTFNIGAGEKTQFIQPSASSVALNRVTGGLGPSQIFGTITANGRVFLINPNGILFGLGSSVNTAGFLATTNDIRNEDFLNNTTGRFNFNIPGRLDASIVNFGHITATNGGFAALVAPGVRNAGVITANLGHVALASGNGFTLDFYGDKLITLQVGDEIANQVIDVATQKPLDSLVKNEGMLKANGGQVTLTAVAARHVVDSVINNTGVIEANTVGTKNGMIVLGAATEDKHEGASEQKVVVSGVLSARGRKSGEKGGTIQITGESIALKGAKIRASGDAGGGTVLIGGDIGGGQVNSAVSGVAQAKLAPWPVATARTVTIDDKTVITASAWSSGDGGKVVVWSDQSTTFAGQIKATGGANSGNGGFAEVSSGGVLSFTGLVNLSAPKGSLGTLLLDPHDIVINQSGRAPKDDHGSSEHDNGNGNNGNSGNGNNGNGNGNNQNGNNGNDNGNSRNGNNGNGNGNSGNDNNGNGNGNNDNGNNGNGNGNGHNGDGNSYIATSTLEKQLTYENVVVANNGDHSGNITVADPLTWKGTAALTLAAANDVYVKAPVSAGDGALTLIAGHDIAVAGSVKVAAFTLNAGGDISATGSVDVGTFTLKNGYWSQVGGDLPGFAAQDFRLAGGTFLRAEGGNGTSSSPYKIADIYGLQGIGSPSGYLLNKNFVLANNIDASVTKTWNGGQGFVPIGTIGRPFTGTLDGRYYVHDTYGDDGGSGGHFANATISHLTIAPNNATTNNIGLFGVNFGMIQNLTLTDVTVNANPNATAPSQYVGTVAGLNLGLINNVSATGSVTGGDNAGVIAGGLVGQNGGLAVKPVIDTQASIKASGPSVGPTFVPGTIINSSANVAVTVGNGACCDSGLNYAGGLAGINSGIIFGSSASGNVTSGANSFAGGLVGANQFIPVGEVGGQGGDQDFAGSAFAANSLGDNVNGGFSGPQIIQSPASGSTVKVGTDGVAGGLAGLNSGDIWKSFSTADVSGAAGSGNGQATSLGGLVGDNEGRIGRSFATGAVGAAGVDSLAVGGLAALNGGTIWDSHASGEVTAGNNSFAGGLVAKNQPGGGIISHSAASGDVTAGSQSIAGGLVAINFGTVRRSSADGGDERSTVSVGANSTAGGLVGSNFGDIRKSFSTANVTGAAGTGGGTTFLGGLAGKNEGLVARSYASGAVGAAADNLEVGGLVAFNGGTIWRSHASGDVTAGNNSTAGGLVAQNVAGVHNDNCAGPCGTISRSSASGDVTVGDGSVAGGLVALSNATIRRSHASGDVTAGNGSTAGGLVGKNSGVIDQTFVDGGEGGSTVKVGADGVAGGLVGANSGNIGRSFSTANVTGAAGTGDGKTFLGGLVGDNEGLVAQSYATGAVGASANNLEVGGLVAFNSGTIQRSHASGDVTAGNGSTAGGLAAENTGTISRTSASGDVTVGSLSLAGGLVGINSGAISRSHAGGDVTAGNNSLAGGLVAENTPSSQNCEGPCGGTITRAGASGNVTVGSQSIAGGLVALNTGTLDRTRATGAVTGGDNSILGGLAGVNDLNGVITNSTVLGSVSGISNSAVGGFVGINGGDIGNSQTAAGVSAVGTSFVGGFVGINIGSVVDSHVTTIVDGAENTHTPTVSVSGT